MILFKTAAEWTEWHVCNVAQPVGACAPEKAGLSGTVLNRNRFCKSL